MHYVWEVVGGVVVFNALFVYLMHRNSWGEA